MESALHPNATCSILLVEDNKINQKVVVLMLAKFGIQPVIAETGQQAVELAAQGGFDLILMDLHMPGMDGMQATRLIRERLAERCPPIVALTADAVRAGTGDARAHGLDGYITKPVSTEILRSCINQHTRFKV